MAARDEDGIERRGLMLVLVGAFGCRRDHAVAHVA